MRTRKELHAVWAEVFQQFHPADHRKATALLAAERAFVDRAAQARAVRFAADMGHVPMGGGWLDALRGLADRIERGELTVPTEES